VATQKLTKQQLKKPDEFLTWGSKAMEFVAGNAWMVGAGALVTLLLIASVFGWLHNRDVRELEASGKLAAGDKILQGNTQTFQGMRIPGLTEPSDDDLKKAVAIFDEVAKDYPGSKAERRAHLLAGDAYLKMKAWDDSAAAYDKASGGDAVDRYYAMSGRGHALEGKGAFDDAAGAYRKIADDKSSNFLRDQASLDLARVLVAAGKKDEARDVLGKFAVEFPDSQWKDDAAAKLADLGPAPTPAATPAAVAGTNASASTTSAVMPAMTANPPMPGASH
jgi:tetratricopeptide (TPR) repeat protein